MLSNRIISSAHFLKMPVSSQALYFHLCINADDDGVVEAWPIMQLGGFAEDDIKVLAAKGMVKVLNEDLVAYITDWREHNLIRADHKVDSIYKTLLLQIIPDAELVAPAPRSDVIDNTARLSGKKGGQSVDSPWTRHGPHSIGKGRVGQESINPPTPQTKIKARDHSDVYQILEAFKAVNVHYDTLQDSKKQYEAAMRMLQHHGLTSVLKVIDILPATNKQPYVTTIITPVQLEERWSTLAAQLAKGYQITNNKPKEILA